MKPLAARPGWRHFAVIAFTAALVGGEATAGGMTLIPDDSNSRITVENAIVKDDETTLLFFTSPDLGDPNSGKPCALNFYSLALRPGLPETGARAVAKGVCGGLLSHGGLLENGDALILADLRLERWRAGEKVSSEPFSSIDATSKLRINTSTGGQLFDFTPDGGLVMAIPVGGYKARDFPGANLVISALRPNGARRWVLTTADSHVGSDFLLRAGDDGGALLRLDTMVPGSMVADMATSLLHVGAAGSETRIPLTEAAAPFDFQSIKTMEDMQRFQEHQANNMSEFIERLGARPLAGGGFDVLFHRKGGGEGREGHFLYRLGADGAIEFERDLGGHIVEHGLDDWFDFYVDGDRLLLLSRVLATQHGVQAVRDQYAQNAVSWIDLDSGLPLTRLIPLDMRYLEGALNAGDAQMKDLPGLPGGDPVMLTEVSGTPVTVSLGIIGGRFTLRVNEATADLVAWSEHYDNNVAAAAKAAQRQQRKQEREARKQQMNADLAASVGMTPEEFDALSNRERKEVMVRQGDPAALQEIMEKHAAAAQQGMPAQQPGVSQDHKAQIAAAMAQAQAQMANNPNIPPEMQAQMAAAMAQLGQYSGAQPGMPAASPQTPSSAGGEKSESGDLVTLDANLRGFLEFENEDGLAMTLVIYNRQTGAELLKKDYPDGSIYEYIDFSRYGLPLDQIGVIYRDVSNQILGEPQLVISP